MPSLRAYRRNCAATFGRLSVITTTDAATGDGAENQIVSEQLLGDGLGETTLAQGWAYVASGSLAGEQRRLVAVPLDPELGIATTGAPFSAIIEEGAEVELLAPIPADRDPLGVDGWRQYINRALSKLSRVDRISLTGDGTYRYGLTSYPWLADTHRIHGLLVDRAAAYGNARALPSTWGIAWDGELAYLETDSAWPATDTLVLAVNRPADTRIKRGGTWTDTAGAAGLDGDDALLSDYDEAIPPVGIVTTLAIREALLSRHQWAPHGEREAWQIEEARWSAKALRAKLAYEGGNSRVVGARTRGYGPAWERMPV